MMETSILSATKKASSVIFSDVNLDVNTESNLELVYNEDAINKSIVNILGTRKGSRVFRRRFGSYVNDILFDPMDSISVSRLKREIIDAIGEWEPRIIMDSAEVLPDYPNQQYFVELNYRIPSLGNKSVTINFNLSRGR
jgi:phage baseplate assembly protein W